MRMTTSKLRTVSMLSKKKQLTHHLYHQFPNLLLLPKHQHLLPFKLAIILLLCPKKRDSPSVEGSAMLENSETVTFMESLKAVQKSQKETNNINTKSFHVLIDSISKMNNATKVDNSFKRITTKMLLEQKYTDFPAIPDSRTQTSLSTWLETTTRIPKTSPWDIDSTSLLEMELPPDFSIASYLIANTGCPFEY